VKRALLISAVAAATVLAVVLAVNLPPRTLPEVASPFSLTWPVVRGAIHVHSQRSDGTGTLDEIAAAAARAGLQFVIFTDHGDGTRPPEPPRYRSGVLCVDGIEISTQYGHYLAIDVGQTPYRLAGHPQAVIEDVRRFGGFGFVAHPDSRKPALQWSDWDLPFDGLEWLNADSQWRDELWGAIGALALTYVFRPVETLGSMLDRPDAVLSRWEWAARSRRVAAIAGADAHARLGYRQASDPYEDRVLARVPSYEVSFRAFVNHVILAAPFVGEAVADARALTAAVREGHMFTSIASFAQLSAFEARALSGHAASVPGGYLDISDPVAIEAAIAAPAGTTLSVVRDGELVYETVASQLRIDVGRQPGAYRIEARLPWQSRTAIPWVLTNPIYVGLAGVHHRAGVVPALSTTRRAPVATHLWTAEASAGSASHLLPVTLADGTPAIEWQYSLSGGERGSQYAAVRFPVSGSLVGDTRLQLRARSDRPHRVWAQLRAAGSGDADRWGVTFFVGGELEQRDLRFQDFRPITAAGDSSPPLERIDSLLLVVDTLNSVPGSTGRIAFTDLWFAW
jgi:hypothetical protein